MGRIGKWIRSKIETYITGIIETRFNNTIQSLLYGQSGDDSPPLPDDKVLLIERDGTGNYAICGILSTSQGANPGERVLFSRDSNGAVKAKIKLDASGNITINNGTDYAVAYTDLASALSGLIIAINSALATKLNGAGSPGAITLDISSSRVDTVRLP